MFNDTQTRRDADEKARALGAVSVGYMVYPTLHEGVFAYYYFNAIGDEVGHYIPDLRSFSELTPPRKWSPLLLRALKYPQPQPYGW